MKNLCIHFNVAVMHIASRLYPCGFEISDDAPDTFEKLMAQFATGKMIIWSGGSEQTIYADREVNYCFRAWHDWCHVRGNHRFTLDGERAVFGVQCQHLLALYGDCEQTRRWCDILYAEIIGQQLYHDTHGQFPDDQRSFVEEFLRLNKAPQLIAAK